MRQTLVKFASGACLQSIFSKLNGILCAGAFEPAAERSASGKATGGPQAPKEEGQLGTCPKHTCPSLSKAASARHKARLEVNQNTFLAFPGAAAQGKESRPQFIDDFTSSFNDCQCTSFAVPGAGRIWAQQKTPM